jgi:hypothetical protein
MPSKPPTSKARRKNAKTAKKLPGNILKRFRTKQLREQEEDVIWGSKRITPPDNKDNKGGNENKNKKGLTRRAVIAKQRTVINLKDI